MRDQAADCWLARCWLLARAPASYGPPDRMRLPHMRAADCQKGRKRRVRTAGCSYRLSRLEEEEEKKRKSVRLQKKKHCRLKQKNTAGCKKNTAGCSRQHRLKKKVAG
jgi:hypothetical protein